MPTAAHLHLVLQHFPILGLPLAGVVLLWGVIRKCRETLLAGAALATLCATLTALAIVTGERTESGYDHADTVDSRGHFWMSEHQERAEKAAVVAYVAGTLAATGAVLVILRRGPARPACSLAAVACLAAGGAAIWAADAGGKIRRPELRLAPGVTSAHPQDASQ